LLKAETAVSEFPDQAGPIPAAATARVVRRAAAGSL
jgi:hypothetical protein